MIETCLQLHGKIQKDSDGLAWLWTVYSLDFSFYKSGWRRNHQEATLAVCNILEEESR